VAVRDPTQRVPSIVMVGAFPPPVHGMATINAVVRDALQNVGVSPLVIDIAAPSLDRSLIRRLGRLPRVLRGLVRLFFKRIPGGCAFYMSVSGGWGQLYELAFVLLARLRMNRVFFHHHTYAYLNRKSVLTTVLLQIAGPSALHIVLSHGMATRLKNLYRVKKVVAVSNAVFFSPETQLSSSSSTGRLATLGFLSNIAPEKGIFEFLDLASAILDAGLPLRAKLAGPFQDEDTEREVRERLSTLPNVEYVGPQYGDAKQAFFLSIDVLVFPTRYVNEAEPLTIHEAMARGVPVIAYSRGAINEIVCPECGNVIDHTGPFVPAALNTIKRWLSDPVAFEATSLAAARRFMELRRENMARWQDVIAELLDGAGGPPREREFPPRVL
jgi:glycosyltransferase involved in cell wall biosynthesis